MPLLCHFIWGNHDWLPLAIGSSFSSGMIEGRFSQYFFPTILVMGEILPITNMLIGFLAYSLAMTLLATRFFLIPAKLKTTLIIIPIITLPYIIEILYFQFIVLSQLIWPLIIVLALLAASKTYQSPHYFLYTGISSILLFFTIGGYPAAANLYVTAALLWLIQKQQQNTSLRNLLTPALSFFITLCFAFVALYFIHIKLKADGTMLDLYNNHITEWKNYFYKLWPTIIKSAQSLTQPQPFFNFSFKVTSLTIIILGSITLIRLSPKIKNKLFSLSGLIALLLCIKFSAWLAAPAADNYFQLNDPAEFMVRTDFYALPCVMMFFLNLILSTSHQCIKNLGYILSIILLWGNLMADINFTKVQILGFHAEANLRQRITDRIQQASKYLNNRYYMVIQAGEISLRPKYYISQPAEKYGLYTLKTPYTRYWTPAEYYNFDQPYPYVLEKSTIQPQDINVDMQKFLTEKIAVWPALDSLFINQHYVIISLTQEGKNLLTQQYQKLTGVRP